MLLLAHLGMVCDYMCVRCCFFFWQPGKKQPGSTFFWLVACSAVFEKYYAGMMVLGLGWWSLMSEMDTDVSFA
jgi:hypothetical protein